jgi:hypothetical protein
MVFIGLGEAQTNKNLHPGWAGINIRDADRPKGYGSPQTRRRLGFFAG